MNTINLCTVTEMQTNGRSLSLELYIIMYSYHYLLDMPKTKSPATFLNITIVTGWFDSFLVTVTQILSEHWTVIRHANHAKK